MKTFVIEASFAIAARASKRGPRGYPAKLDRWRPRNRAFTVAR